MRSTGSTTIAFGLVSVPVKLFTATSEHDLKFNTIHDACGSRISRKDLCPVCDESVATADCVKGHEISKGQFVTFTAEEIKAQVPSQFETLEIEAFVPADSIDPVYIEKSIYVGPDKGADRAFNLMVRAMRQTDRVAVGRYMSRGKVYTAMLRPFEKGMVLHHLFWADEVRNYDEVNIGPDVAFSDKELDLAAKLIGELETAAFDPAMFKDEYHANLTAAIEAKGSGKAVVIAPAMAPKAAVVDLMEALMMSIEDEKAKSKSKSKAKPKAKAKAKAN